MCRWMYLILAACLALAVPTAYAEIENDGKPIARLNNRTESLLQQKILPAYRLSDRLQLLDGLSSATARLKPEQLEELTKWKGELDEVNGLYTSCIRRYLTSYGESGTRTVRSSSGDIVGRFCRAVLDAERREISMGTATQTTYTNEGGFGNVGEGAAQ